MDCGPPVRVSCLSVGSKYIVAYVLAAMLLIGGGVVWYSEHSAASEAARGVLTPEAKAYVHYLQLSGVTMKAAETYIKQTVTEINGKITNTGNRPVNSVEVFCSFRDSYGQLVLRQRSSIVRQGPAPLKPGETRDFRLAFDNLPDSWNNQMPQLVIAHIGFD